MLALLFTVALVVIIVLVVRSDKGSRWLDALRYRLPLFGEIWMKYQIAMFSRTLSTLLTGGLPLVPSLETASQSINSFKISSNVGYASNRVREGRSLSFSLEETNFFPDLAIEMIEVGEDVQNSLSTAMQLVEPVILIFMGITVAVVLLSLYLPIFSLGAQAHP